jgi:hypothetical protein
MHPITKENSTCRTIRALRTKPLQKSLRFEANVLKGKAGYGLAAKAALGGGGMCSNTVAGPRQLSTLLRLRTVVKLVQNV